MADISKITLPNGSEYNIKDANAVPKTRTINGYDLTQNRNLTAADVGALPSDGTSHSSYILFPTKVYPRAIAGWYKFAEISLSSSGNTGRAKITFKYGVSNSSYDYIGEIFVYRSNNALNATIQIPYMISGKNSYFCCNIDSSTTASFYVYRHDGGGPSVFTIITSENEDGDYLNPSTYMLESLVAENPPGTAIKPIYSAINRWVYNVPVSPGTNEQILSYSLGMITSASVLAKIEFANPEYIKSDCSWETTDGANPNDNGTITITGTCTAATTANLLILNVLPD